MDKKYEEIFTKEMTQRDESGEPTGDQHVQLASLDPYIDVSTLTRREANRMIYKLMKEQGLEFDTTDWATPGQMETLMNIYPHMLHAGVTKDKASHLIARFERTHNMDKTAVDVRAKGAEIMKNFKVIRDGFSLGFIGNSVEDSRSEFEAYVAGFEPKYIINGSKNIYIPHVAKDMDVRCRTLEPAWEHYRIQDAAKIRNYYLMKMVDVVLAVYTDVKYIAHMRSICREYGVAFIEVNLSK